MEYAFVSSVFSLDIQIKCYRIYGTEHGWQTIGKEKIRIGVKNPEIPTITWGTNG